MKIGTSHVITQKAVLQDDHNFANLLISKMLVIAKLEEVTWYIR